MISRLCLSILRSYQITSQLYTLAIIVVHGEGELELTLFDWRIALPSACSAHFPYSSTVRAWYLAAVHDSSNQGRVCAKVTTVQLQSACWCKGSKVLGPAKIEPHIVSQLGKFRRAATAAFKHRHGEHPILAPPLFQPPIPVSHSWAGVLLCISNRIRQWILL